MPGYQAFSFTRRTSAATAKLLLCRLTENVAYSFIFLLEIWFVNFSPGLFQEYLFYTTQLISWLPFVRNFQTECEFRNRLSNSSLFVVVMFLPKMYVPCARARNDRNWREKRSTRSSLPAVMSTVVEQAFVLS